MEKVTIENVVESTVRPVLLQTLSSRILFENQARKYKKRKSAVQALISVAGLIGLAIGIFAVSLGDDFYFYNVQVDPSILQVIILFLVIVVYEIERNTGYTLKVVVSNRIVQSCSSLETEIRQNIVNFKSQIDQDKYNLDQMMSIKINDWFADLNSIVSLSKQSDVGIYPSDSETEDAKQRAVNQYEETGF